MQSDRAAGRERRLAGRYRLGRVLGSGGAGIVREGEDMLLRRPVAIKQVRLPPLASETEREIIGERVLREARAAARLRHPGLVAVYDVIDAEDSPWIVMELVDGRSLAEEIRASGRLAPTWVARIGVSLAYALEAAHRAGVVHRDVKPGNVLLTADGQARLTDFGIAVSEGDATLTSTGMVVGSPAYIPPERARGARVGVPGDVWGLGATLFTAVEGEAPYAGEGALATLAAIIQDRRRPYRYAGPLQDVIDQLLDPDPARRPSLAQARAQLRRIAATAEPHPTAVFDAEADALLDADVGDRPDADHPDAPPSGPAGAEEHADLGPDDDLGTGTGTGGSAGSGAGRGAGPGPPAGTGPRTGPRAGFGFGSGTGPAARTGSSEAGPGPGPSPGAGPGPGPDSAAGARAGGAGGAPERRRRVVLLAMVVALLLAAGGVGLGLALTGGSGTPSAGQVSGTGAPATPAGTGGPSPGASTSPAGGQAVAPGASATPSGTGTAPATPGQGGSVGVPSLDRLGTAIPNDTAPARAPAGLETRRGAAGWSLAVPPQWADASRDRQHETFTAPGGYPDLLVETQDVAGPSSIRAWEELEPGVRSKTAGYQRVSIRPSDGADGTTSAVWEFTFTTGGQTVHVLDFGVVRNGHGYALRWRVPEAQWQDQLELIRTITATFRPGGP
ncbi:protein kinase [Frankia sp. Mgl5]|uniref:serine/threonine-protein kinase n=1 Tax=Frankia sp. Mgl5 TaxID=2933793 RepID=UPI00200C33D5|nr:serine/threonine-protein kinase [Frankia sp. Mgl5]MCK9929705.1 protein kinase [Frankia sp. Mgl5]